MPTLTPGLEVPTCSPCGARMTRSSQTRTIDSSRIQSVHHQQTYRCSTPGCEETITIDLGYTDA